MTIMSCSPEQVFLRCRNMGSTLSAPCAYLQKQGWPWMGIPASLEIFRSWSVKPLEGENTKIKPLSSHQHLQVVIESLGRERRMKQRLMCSINEEVTRPLMLRTMWVSNLFCKLTLTLLYSYVAFWQFTKGISNRVCWLGAQHQSLPERF